MAAWLVHQRLHGVVRSKYAGAVPLAYSGTRQPDVPSQDVGAELPRIWRMMSSGSVAAVKPAVQAEDRFCEIDANFDAEPKRSSR